MKYQLMIRSRPFENLFLKHDRLMAFLSGLKNEWGVKEGAETPKVKDPGTLPMRIVHLSNCFHKGITALVSYQNRKYHRDEGMFDDYFTMEFDPTGFNFELLATNVFERIIECFQAYIGEIGDEKFIHLDFENSRRVDSRSGVYRIYPVCFFDRELCDRSFHLTPEDIAQRLTGVVERVRVLSNGVSIIASSKIVTIEEANVINERIRGLLT